MAERRSERVVIGTDGGGPPLRSGPNPGLLVGAVLVALLVMGLIAFGMNISSGAEDGAGGDRVEVAVPDGSDDNEDDADADVDADVDADADTEDDSTDTTEGESTDTTKAP